MRKFLLAVFLVLCAGTSLAQVNQQPMRIQNYVPTGPCTLPNQLVMVTVNPGAGLYQCITGVWQASGGGGAVQTITGLTYTQDDTTIVATWYTSGNSNTVLTCGGNAAVDNNVQTNVTFHQAVVAGLSPSTLYSCSVTSGSTTSTAQNVTTNAAATRTPLTAVAFGSPTTTSVHGDTVDSFISNDNKTYVTEDDGYGFTGTPNAGANMQVGLLTTEATLVGTTVNLLTSYGAFDTTNGTDGPSGAAQTNKLSGIFSMAGKLYLWANRDQYGTTGNLTQTAWYGNIMKSLDHGATWNSFVNPTVPPLAAGIAPSGTPPTPFMFGLSTIGWCAPVRYAADDGTLGYTTPGNRIDGANAFVYLDCTDGWFINSNNLYLLRIPRAQMDNQNPGAVQYWVGPSSPSPTQFVNPSNWSNSASGLTAIYSATGQTNGADLIFVPGVNYYALATWYNPGTIGGTQVSSNSTWNVFAGPTPAGPWTNIGSQNNNPAGYYNPTALHRTFASNTLTSNIPVTYVYSGDYNTGNATYYYPTHSVFTFNQSSSYTSPTYRTGCTNVPGAGATTTVTCTLTATGGDFGFVVCRGGESVTQVVTSSPSSTYTQMGQVNNSSGSNQASYAFGLTGGSTTFTCTASGGGTTYQGIAVLDYAPGSVTTFAGGSGNVINSSTSTFTSSAVSVTGSAFYVVCGDAQYGPPATITAGNINGSAATGRLLTSQTTVCEDLSVIPSTSGAVGTLTASSAGNWDGVIAVFQ